MRRSLRRVVFLAAALLVAAAALTRASYSVFRLLPAPPWSRGAPIPTARGEIAATLLEGRLYVAGGLTLTGVSRAFEAYDIASNTWEVRAPLPVALHHTALASNGNRIYLSGGIHRPELCPSARFRMVLRPPSESLERAARHACSARRARHGEPG